MPDEQQAGQDDQTAGCAAEELAAGDEASSADPMQHDSGDNPDSGAPDEDGGSQPDGGEEPAEQGGGGGGGGDNPADLPLESRDDAFAAAAAVARVAGPLQRWIQHGHRPTVGTIIRRFGSWRRAVFLALAEEVAAPQDTSTHSTP